MFFFTVNAQKQATAFPPNFIHSLDATHMLLTALECRVRLPPVLQRDGGVAHRRRCRHEA
jgi:hypothetical protein